MLLRVRQGSLNKIAVPLVTSKASCGVDRPKSEGATKDKREGKLK